MIGSLKQILAGIKDLWGRLNPNQRVVASVVLTAVLVGLIFLTSLLRHVNYEVLYSGLDPKETGAVVGALEKNKIPYVLSAGGSTIKVPSKRIHEARIKVAGEGLPHTGVVGYEIFDKSNFGVTDFVQNINYRRALEGELTRTIQQLDEVQAARVHIVLPKAALFRENQSPPTASIMLKLHPGASLNGRQIQGITHLVASSVEGLSPSNITVIDYEGNLLSDGTGREPVAALTATQLELQQQVDSYLERKAQSLLDQVLGPQKSIVRVTANLNFQQIEKTIEQYDPDGTVVRSEQRISQGSTEGGQGENIITNYEIDKTLEHIVENTGNIDKLSIALIVDPIVTDKGGGVRNRSPEEIERISTIVKNAVGFVDGRDQFEVSSLPFDRSHLAREQELLDKAAKRERRNSIMHKLEKVLILIVGLLILNLILKKIAKAVDLRRVPATSRAGADEQKRLEIDKKNKMLIEASNIARQKPYEAAKLIKTMLEES